MEKRKGKGLVFVQDVVFVFVFVVFCKSFLVFCCCFEVFIVFCRTFSWP